MYYVLRAYTHSHTTLLVIFHRMVNHFHFSWILTVTSTYSNVYCLPFPLPASIQKWMNQIVDYCSDEWDYHSKAKKGKLRCMDTVHETMTEWVMSPVSNFNETGVPVTKSKNPWKLRGPGVCSFPEISKITEKCDPCESTFLWDHHGTSLQGPAVHKTEAMRDPL